MVSPGFLRDLKLGAPERRTVFGNLSSLHRHDHPTACRNRVQPGVSHRTCACYADIGIISTSHCKNLTLDPPFFMIARGSAMGGVGQNGTRCWRTLLSVVVAYTVAIQSLLIAVAGFSLPADAGQNAPPFELCLHDGSGAPELPAGNPDQSGCTHCIFCFAGAQHAVIGTAPAIFHRINVAMVVVPRLGDRSGLRWLTRYTIASPRGPPFSA
jgi:hypothetical protein